jgi:hypothetical protein
LSLLVNRSINPQKQQHKLKTVPISADYSTIKANSSIMIRHIGKSVNQSTKTATSIKQSLYQLINEPSKLTAVS